MGWGAAGLGSLCLYCRGACGDVSTPPVRRVMAAVWAGDTVAPQAASYYVTQLPGNHRSSQSPFHLLTLRALKIGSGSGSLRRLPHQPVCSAEALLARWEPAKEICILCMYRWAWVSLMLCLPQTWGYAGLGCLFGRALRHMRDVTPCTLFWSTTASKGVCWLIPMVAGCQTGPGSWRERLGVRGRRQRGRRVGLGFAAAFPASRQARRYCGGRGGIRSD
jgi:hypothetical protein